MEIENPHLTQIRELIDQAAKYSHLEFRLKLEELVKQGGNEVQNTIIHYITSPSVPGQVRFNLIRMASYIRSTAFLPPLQRIIEVDPDPNLKMAAIICIAKYNDRRAVDILHRALETIRNPQLQETINAEIAKIRQNNPLVALMPKFLRGGRNPRTFAVIVKIFRKILTPADAKCFIPHLTHDDPLIAHGAFEILCHRGDETIQFFIAGYIRRFLEEHDWRTEQEVTRLADMLDSLRAYRQGYPAIGPELQPDFARHLHRPLPAEVRTLIEPFAG